MVDKLERDHSVIIVHKPPYFTLWALWLLATVGYGVVWAAEIYFRGAADLLGVYSTYFGGPLLGILQGLVLRRCFIARGWWNWILSSSAAWLVAVLIMMVLGGITLAGTGLNPGADVRGCLVVVCGLAGYLFGLAQAGFSQIKFDAALWAIINAFAWTVGAFVGGIIGLAAHRAMFPPWRYTSSIDTPQFTMGVVLGVLTAMVVIGAVTGLGVVAQTLMNYQDSTSEV